MSKKIRRSSLKLSLLGLCFLTGFSAAESMNTPTTPVTVVVGGYSFPPYVIDSPQGHSGVVPELIDELNRLGSGFQFSFVPTSIEHRYQAFTRRRFDVLLFESPHWGWEQIDKAVLPLKVPDGEVFVGRHPAAAAPDYFADLQQKRLLLVRGYHYHLAGFETDEMKLRQDYLAELVPDSRAALEGLLLGRAEVAPISQSFLSWYLAAHPDKANKLVISSRWDQQYQHTALLHPQSPLTPEAFSQLLNTLSERGVLKALLGKYHLTLTEAQ